MSPQGLPKPRRERLGTCGFCGRPLYGTPRCTRRRCPGYRHLWVRDQREVIRTNLAAYDEGTGLVAFGTLTGPGARLLPWDQRACRGLGPHRCSGDLGCVVSPSQAIAFNLSASKRHATLHRLAAQRVQRSCGHRPVVLVRVWECQRRGVVHAHVVLGAGTEVQETAARHYLRLLHELGPRHGFGFADSTVRLREPLVAASYCVKRLAETVAEPSSPRTIVWVSRRLSGRTGCTVRALRHHRFVHATGTGAGT